MIRRIGMLFWPWVALSVIIWATMPCAAAEEGHRLSAGQTVYVPVYSHIYAGNQQIPIYLAATLSIRNTDLHSSLKLIQVEYYGSDGKLIKAHLDNPVQVSPLAATHYTIKESDKSGGSGASFLVKWQANHPIQPPLIESIMIGTQLQNGISFTSRGQVLK